MTVARVTQLGISVIRNADTTVVHARATQVGISVIRGTDSAVRHAEVTQIGISVIMSVAQREENQGGIMLAGL